MPRLTESEKKAGRAFEAEIAKAERHVGRFMGCFAALEGGVDRALSEIFDLKPVLFFLLTGNLDLRKKLAFIQVAMESKGIKDSKGVIKKIHKLHDTRNVIAHRQFFPFDDGIEFERVTHAGKLDSHFYSYSRLKSYVKEISEIEDELVRIGALLSPVTDEAEDFACDVEKIIEQSTNIIRLPSRSENSEEN
jgi:hypothetical protein